MSDENGRLVCISPDATREYQISGGVFQIGVLPKDVYAKIVEIQKGKAFDKLWLAVQYGIKGHENLAYEDGSAVPFKTAKDSKGREIVAEETLQIYLATGIVSELASEAIRKGGGKTTRAAMAPGPLADDAEEEL